VLCHLFMLSHGDNYKVIHESASIFTLASSKHPAQSKLIPMQILYGVHSVEEALRAGKRRFDHVCFSKDRQDLKLDRIAQLCRDANVLVRTAPKDHLTRLAKTEAHQGVVAVVRPQESYTFEDILGTGGTPRPEDAPPLLLLALDGVEDPQNLGALLRTADGAGVDGVILTERRAAPLSPVAVKASAGAAEHIRIARVVNLVRALEQMKEAGLWVIGLDERGTQFYDEYDFSGPTVLVLGREGAGLHDLVRKNCDHLLRIPMAGGVSSLNVSAAGAVVLYEAARQRRNGEQPASAVQKLPAAKTVAKVKKGLGS